jgi:hypothetical protein
MSYDPDLIHYISESFPLPSAELWWTELPIRRHTYFTIGCKHIFQCIFCFLVLPKPLVASEIVEVAFEHMLLLKIPGESKEESHH